MTQVCRITVNPDVRLGKPCVRGHRITVAEVIHWLARGANEEQILADYPQLEADDFPAIYAFAGNAGESPTLQGMRLCSDFSIEVMRHKPA